MKKQNLIEVGAEPVPDPEAAAAEAVASYDPTKDFRIWRQVCEVWRLQCAELVEIAEGLSADNRPAGEIARRLRKEFEDRSKQDPSWFAEAANEFRKLASEWAAGQVSAGRTAGLYAQMQELHRERAAAIERAAEQDRLNRLREAEQLEARAAELRQGRPSMKSSYLAR
jgi:hypothetical protein